MANLNDKLRKKGASTVTTLSAPGKALGATSLTVGSTTNYPTDTGIIVAIRIVDTAGKLVAGTYTEWKATVASGTSLAINATPVYGSDQVYPAGSTTQVYIPLSSFAENDMIDAILAEHNQSGQHTLDTISEKTSGNGVTIDSLNIKDGKLNTNNSVVTANITDGAVTPDKLTNTYMCSLYKTTSQSIASGSWTASTFANENYDAASMHDNSTNTSRITIPTGGDGYYLFVGQCMIADNATGGRGIKIAFNGNLNGSTEPKDLGGVFDIAVSGLPWRRNVTTIRYMAAGEYVELGVFQNSGGALDLQANTAEYNLGTYLIAHRLA